jgi:hypothetical protein
MEEAGLPAFSPSGVPASQIEAFSGRFQDWKQRDPASDDAVLAYMKARLYWSWKYSLSRTLFSSHDLLRLGVDVSVLHRLAQLEEGRLWRTHSRSAFGISIEPLAELLRTQKENLDAPQPPLPPPASMTQPEEPPTDKSSAEPGEPAKPVKKPIRSAKPRRRKGKASDATALVFVDEARLTDLRRLSPTDFDLRKLIAICDELNLCYRSQCYFAVAALTRALLDHVPPIFGVDTFAKVANNYGGGKSFSGSMQHLESSARHIADGHLHGRIRKKESLPTRTQVNFAADVDVLLAEVVRILS